MDDATLTPEAEERFNEYLDQIGGVLRDKRQRASFSLYAAGLLSDGARKSMEPMAARASGDAGRVSAVHHQLNHFSTSSAWKDEPIRRLSARYAVAEMEEREDISSWIIDDTGFIKQGRHSPGVQRQYTGSAGKKTNCQIGVSLVVANSSAELPIDFRLYLPESWTDDRRRCKAAHIPDDVGYSPKWRLALDMVESARESQVSPGIVLADSAYGNVGDFRDGINLLGLKYAVDVQKTTVVRRVGRHGKLGKPMSVRRLAQRLKSRFRKTSWREGSKATLQSRFARVRVVVGREPTAQRGPEWLLIEWPENEVQPTHYVLSTLPKRTSVKSLVRTVKNRWRIERSYEDLKGQLGLDHYEGRSFIGWHHHITVALACYAFLVAERARSFPPSIARTCSDGSFLNAA